MKKPFNWIWESELQIYADNAGKTLEQFINDSEIQYFRVPEGDYGDKVMYAYKLKLDKDE